MSKRSIIIRACALCALIMMIPALLVRIDQENNNKDVIAAVNYNNFEMTLSSNELIKSLNDFHNAGVKTAFVAEESVNSLIYAGYITGIKYNVLCHKYDDESEDIISALLDNPDIHNDSYVLITKRAEGKNYLKKWIPAKYKENEYTFVKTALGADVYVLYDGSSEAWQISTGFIDEKIKNAHDMGFDIVLSMMVNNYSTTEYINILRDIIKKYNIRYINLKDNYKKTKETDKEAQKNTNALCALIKDNNLNLVLTENQDQLSNQKPTGYAKFIESAEGRILRCYETITLSTADEIDYKSRYYQMLNSVVDRNIRMVCINQLMNGSDSFEKKTERTLKSTELFMDKLHELGYNTDSFNTDFSKYITNRRLTSAAGVIIMIIMLLTMWEWLFGKSAGFQIFAFAAAVLSFVFTFLAPMSILLLYPTLFAAIAPCFCVAAVFVIIKSFLDKLGLTSLILLGSATALLSLSICGAVQAALLSGCDYYVNTLIFRGIKLSLILPILFAAVAFGILFCKKDDEKTLLKVSEILNADIKVFWVIISAILGFVAVIYLVRSGNVKSISPLESAMRNTITDNLSARPRTKEFLLGWPCFVLMIFYLKKYGGKLISWIFAVGGSILFASTINSFCHVFTSVSTVYMRIIHALWLGALFSLFMYILNLSAVMCYERIKFFIEESEKNESSN